MKPKLDNRVSRQNLWRYFRRCVRRGDVQPVFGTTGFPYGTPPILLLAGLGTLVLFHGPAVGQGADQGQQFGKTQCQPDAFISEE